MIKFKARNERNSRAIAKFRNAGIDYFRLKLMVHVLIRGSLLLDNKFQDFKIEFCDPVCARVHIMPWPDDARNRNVTSRPSLLFQILTVR